MKDKCQSDETLEMIRIPSTEETLLNSTHNYLGLAVTELHLYFHLLDEKMPFSDRRRQSLLYIEQWVQNRLREINND